MAESMGPVPYNRLRLPVAVLNDSISPVLKPGGSCASMSSTTGQDITMDMIRKTVNSFVKNCFCPGIV
jgi:hypothetical protein